MFQNDTNESPIIEYGPIKAVYNTRNYPTLVTASSDSELVKKEKLHKEKLFYKIWVIWNKVK